MREKKSEVFYAYRYFLTNSGQLSLFEGESLDRKEKMDGVLRKISDEGIRKETIKGQEYLTIYVKRYGDALHLFKFSKKREQVKFELVKQDIQPNEQLDYPFCYLLIDTTRQQFLISRNTVVFQKPEQGRNAVEGFFQVLLGQTPWNIGLREITNSAPFWESVKDADKIYMLRFELSSPNLFGNLFKTNELLKKVKELQNSELTTFQFNNKQGGLRITKEELQDTVEYANNGGGTWTMKLVPRGEKKKITLSGKLNVKTTTVQDFEVVYEKMTAEDWEARIETVDTLDLERKNGDK